MSEEEKKAAEEAAAREKQLKDDEEAKAAAAKAEEEDDLQAKYNALEEENKKVVADRDNYRKGLLSLKAKKKAEGDPDGEGDDDNKVDIDELVERKINEKLLSSEEYRIKKEKDDLIVKALKENKELKLALKTKDGTPSAGAGQGGNQDQKKSDVEFFSEAQKAEIKARELRTGVKIDLKKLEETMRRNMSK